MNTSAHCTLAGLALSLVLLAAAPAFAAETFLTGDKLLETGKLLTPDEIKAVVKPGVTIETFWPSTGSQRYWVSDSSGSFTAYRRGGTGNSNSNGAGAWRFNDTGEYCVSIDWKTSRNFPDFTEKWCYALYKVGDDLYFAPAKLDAKQDKKYAIVRFK